MLSSVASAGEAADAGLQVGDRIQRMNGQPVLSIADIQWVLDQAPKTGNLKLVVDRRGTQEQLNLKLTEGWKQRGKFAWRYSYNELKWKVLGLDQLRNLTEVKRKQLGIQKGESGIRIGKVITGKTRWHRANCNLSARRVGLRGGDVILSIDGQGRLDESRFMAYILQRTKPRDRITLTILRNGLRKKFTYPLKRLNVSP